jgi:hypothetical protein
VALVALVAVPQALQVRIAEIAAILHIWCERSTMEGPGERGSYRHSVRWSTLSLAGSLASHTMSTVLCRIIFGFSLKGCTL